MRAIPHVGCSWVDLVIYYRLGRPTEIPFIKDTYTCTYLDFWYLPHRVVDKEEIIMDCQRIKSEPNK